VYSIILKGSSRFLRPFIQACAVHRAFNKWFNKGESSFFAACSVQQQIGRSQLLARGASQRADYQPFQIC
jgi:CMP-N-acetylneuraminic acid synthetase